MTVQERFEYGWRSYILMLHTQVYHPHNVPDSGVRVATSILSLIQG